MIYFLLFFQQILASTTHIVGQDAGTLMLPTTVIFFRSTIAAAALAVILMVRYRKLNIFSGIDRTDYLMFVAVGLLNVPLNQMIFLTGLQMTTPANSALLYSLTPALVYIIDLLLRAEQSSRAKTIGIAVAFVGVSIIVFQKGASLHQDYLAGNLVIFAAVICWSLYTVLGRNLVRKYGALKVTGVNMILGTLYLLPFSFMFMSSDAVSQIPILGWDELLYLALIASVVNYLLWFYALGKLETSKVAIFQNLQPVMTTLLALALGRAFITPEFVAGGSMVLVGVFVVQRG